jgi:two-component system, NarL family, sensor histidine kinase UhpB
MFKDSTPLRILVIEDNPGDLRLIEDYISDQFTKAMITAAPSMSAAKSILVNTQSSFDIILLDLSLPDKSGETLLKEICQVSGGSVIIVLTGFSDIGFSIRSLALGASDYLVKDDINASTLYKSILYNIERKKTNQQLAESEKRFSNLFQLSPQPMWVFDPRTLKIMQVNLAALRQYGYNESEFLQLSIMDIRPAEDIARVEELMKRSERTEPLVGTQLFRHRKKNGEVFNVEIYSSPIILNNMLYRSVIAIDVTEKTLIDHRITKAIIKTQEDERYEIGGELHDNVCQLLATSQMLMGMLGDSLEPPGIKIYEQCKQYISLALDDIRKISHRLAPTFFENTSMEEVFRTLIANSTPGGDFLIETHFSKSATKYAPTRDIQINLYRILQEQLRNITKHSQAKTVSVDIDITDDKLQMRIADDGVGFDPGTTRDGIGLANMKRRAELFAGTMDIASAPGKGCTITIIIPVSNDAVNDETPEVRQALTVRGQAINARV